MKSAGTIILFTLLFGSLVSSCCKDHDNPDPDDCICYEIYAPVCGDDGEVYPNDCYAECAGVNYTAGYCPETDDATIINTGPIPADGCGWLIEIPIQDTFLRYSPVDLAPSFQTDGLEVTVTYRKLLSYMTCGLMANHFVEIEVIDIQAK